MAPLGVPVLTAVDGIPVAQYPGGEVVPLQITGGPDGQSDSGAGGPVPQQTLLASDPLGAGGAAGRAAPAGGGAPRNPALPGLDGGGYEPVREPVSLSHSEPRPVYGSQALSTGGGGRPTGGSAPTLASGKARLQGALASAQGRIQGALGAQGGESAGGATSSGIGGGGGQERLRGRWARGMNPTQAAGLLLRPTGMLPRVFPGASPAEPAYTTLANLPAAQMALLMGGKGSTQRTVNNLGRLYQRAGTTGGLPSTGRMLGNLQSSKGIRSIFEGEKAGRGEMESFSVPGYEYGNEPLLLGEAASTYGGLLDAALYNEPAQTQMKYSGTLPGGWGSYLLDRWASKAAKHKPGKGPAVNRFVGRRLFRSG